MVRIVEASGHGITLGERNKIVISARPKPFRKPNALCVSTPEQNRLSVDCVSALVVISLD